MKEDKVRSRKIPNIGMNIAIGTLADKLNLSREVADEIVNLIIENQIPHLSFLDESLARLQERNEWLYEGLGKKEEELAELRRQVRYWVNYRVNNTHCENIGYAKRMDGEDAV